MNLFIITFMWIFAVFIQESRGVTVIQSKAESVSEGQNVNIKCTTNPGIDGWGLSWYQQKPGEAPKLLIKSVDERYGDTPDRFSGNGAQGGTDFTLSISGVKREDAGHYYCMSRHSISGSYVYTFGGGTRLDVGNPVKPTVSVLLVSSEEISSKQTATLMCVVSKGFPSDWSLSWKVDGNSRSQENSAGLLQKDGLYSWSSSLTLSEHDWIKSVSVSCEATRGDQTVTGQVQRDQCSQ